MPNNLSLCTTAYNISYTTLKCVTTCYFHLSIPDVNAFLFEAHTIHHYIDYSNILILDDNIPNYIPAFYNIFAQEINKHNNSDYFWLYFQKGKIVWKEGFTLLLLILIVSMTRISLNT
ncbi:hypothetical protein B0H13DRAFT_2338211 [Mycena leptocephala]|nr:hypothetical protein B0H13DRAFT_2338211 [Mycena leptocephala]